MGNILGALWNNSTLLVLLKCRRVKAEIFALSCVDGCGSVLWR